MPHKRGHLFFHNEKHQHNLRVATFIMFLSLVVERLIYNADISYNSGNITAFLSIKPADCMCILVYFSVSILLALKVKYAYLLIPDFFLLGVKLYTAGASIYKVTALYTHYSEYEIFTYFSKAVESILFSLFLILLFIGKLCHTKRSYSKRYPFVCMHLLIACFPVTVVFEIIKAIIAYNGHYNPIVTLIQLAGNVVQEAFLDLPYLLLLMLLAFVPQNRYYK